MNRKIYILSFFAIFLFACAERNTPEPIDFEKTDIVETTVIDIPAIRELNIIKYVNAPAGLNVRNSPDINSDRIGGLIDLTEVLAIREDGEVFTIDGIDGKWTFIEVDDIQGWVFGGFLSSVLPVREDIIVHIARHILEYFNFWNLTRYRDNNTLDGFLSAMNIGGEYEIVRQDTFSNIHGRNGDVIFDYFIRSGQYIIRIWYVPEIPRHLLQTIEVELSGENFLNLFPYLTMNEYLNSDRFGVIRRYGENYIDYTPSWQEWRLLFYNNELRGIRFDGLIP